ncbi:hypothetical protein GQ54DRAFT_326070 [Martensiomyces pterosporus]|nr:hypothetical protein GQ54DRAFT_326070 [Martensiomyces pterosporus]
MRQIIVILVAALYTAVCAVSADEHKHEGSRPHNIFLAAKGDSNGETQLSRAADIGDMPELIDFGSIVAAFSKGQSGGRGANTAAEENRDREGAPPRPTAKPEDVWQTAEAKRPSTVPPAAQKALNPPKAKQGAIQPAGHSSHAPGGAPSEGSMLKASGTPSAKPVAGSTQAKAAVMSSAHKVALCAVASAASNHGSEVADGSESNTHEASSAEPESSSVHVPVTERIRSTRTVVANKLKIATKFDDVDGSRYKAGSKETAQSAMLDSRSTRTVVANKLKIATKFDDVDGSRYKAGSKETAQSAMLDRFGDADSGAALPALARSAEWSLAAVFVLAGYFLYLT